MEKLKVTLHDKPDFECPKCQCTIFNKVHSIKVVPPFVAGNDKPMLVPMDGFGCNNCGYAYQQEDVENFIKEKFEYTGKLFTNGKS